MSLPLARRPFLTAYACRLLLALIPFRSTPTACRLPREKSSAPLGKTKRAPKKNVPLGKLSVPLGKTKRAPREN